MKLFYGLFIVLLTMFFALSSYAEKLPSNDLINGDGEVRVPLTDYTKMLQQTQHKPRAAPAPYAIGESQISIQIVEQNQQVSASN